MDPGLAAEKKMLGECNAPLSLCWTPPSLKLERDMPLLPIGL